MPGNAFVYGTLMADEVLKLLIQRVPVSRSAHVTGFTRYKVKGQVFPAIIPSEKTAKVNGKVLLDLTDKELHVLDGTLMVAMIMMVMLGWDKPWPHTSC